MNSERIGSSFESLLEDEGIRDEVDAVAQKRVSAWEIPKVPEAAGMEPLPSSAQQTVLSRVDGA